jgi:hypothetical protein
MAKITRTPTRATGGITEQERQQLSVHTQRWIANALSTEPVNPERLTKAIHSLYAAANLNSPRVVIVDSPRTMAFAGGFAAAIWYLRQSDAADAATRTVTINPSAPSTALATSNDCMI